MENIKNGTLLYDIMSCPQGITIDQLLEIFKNEGVLLWDSQRGGMEPKIVNWSNDVRVVKVKTINGRMLTLKEYEAFGTQKDE